MFKRETQVVISPGAIQITNWDNILDIKQIIEYAKEILPVMSGEVETQLIGFQMPDGEILEDEEE